MKFGIISTVYTAFGSDKEQWTKPVVVLDDVSYEITEMEVNFDTSIIDVELDEL